MKTLIIGSGMAGLTAAAYLVSESRGGVGNVMARARKAVRMIEGEKR